MVTSFITPDSLAAAVSVAVENVQSTPVVETLRRKYLLFGQANPDLEGEKYETAVLYQVKSAEEVGNRFGYGYEIYRLAKWAFAGSQGVETWVLVHPPEEPNGSPSQTFGLIQITANGVLAGTLHLYISGEYVPVRVNDDDTAADIENAIVAAINADRTLFVYGETDFPVSEAANIITKNDGVYGNYVKISFNEGYAQEFPVGVSVVVTQPTGGTGFIIPRDDNFFDILGFNDEQNELYFTDLVISNPGLNTTVFDNLSEWNGTITFF